MMTHSSNGLLALADLLKPQNEESDEDEVTSIRLCST